ncbi:MAG: TIR domain-containing protein [Nitrosarchaeum sp.]|nr:TIR domain-containing protein [Nitrosarchaeum sp.]
MPTYSNRDCQDTGCLTRYHIQIHQTDERRKADYIKQQIRNKIDAASVTVCLIGHSTHKSEWVDWEIVASNAKKRAL